MRGLALGVVNYSRGLNAAQLGAINFAADQTSHRVLPVLNWGREH
jgi:hypothetical protein